MNPAPCWWHVSEKGEGQVGEAVRKAKRSGGAGTWPPGLVVRTLRAWQGAGGPDGAQGAG